MDDKQIDFKVALNAWAASLDPGEHLTDEVLGDYHQGRLDGSAEERVLDHLAHCRSCLELWRDWRAFSAAAEPRAADAPADFEAAALWRSLRPRLDESRPDTGRAGGGWQKPALLAACLALVALGATSIQQNLKISELRNPRANVEIYDLYVDTTERSGAGAADERMLSPSAGLILFTPRDAGEFPDYEVAILGRGGDPVWSGRGFAADPDDGTFSLWLPPGFLPEGDYTVRLSGVDGESTETIEEYGLHVER